MAKAGTPASRVLVVGMDAVSGRQFERANSRAENRGNEGSVAGGCSRALCAGAMISGAMPDRLGVTKRLPHNKGQPPAQIRVEESQRSRLRSRWRLRSTIWRAP